MERGNGKRKTKKRERRDNPNLPCMCRTKQRGQKVNEKKRTKRRRENEKAKMRKGERRKNLGNTNLTGSLNNFRYIDKP